MPVAAISANRKVSLNPSHYLATVLFNKVACRIAPSFVSAYLLLKKLCLVVNFAAAFGPDGRLYILTVTEALADIRKKNPELKDPLPMRLDVVDPETFQAVRTIPCDAGIKAFGVMDGGRLVYVYEDAEGELTLKAVRY